MYTKFNENKIRKVCTNVQDVKHFRQGLKQMSISENQVTKVKYKLTRCETLLRIYFNAVM